MSQKSSDRFVLNWTEACDRMISQHLSKSVLKRMKMSGNGSNYPKSDDSHLKSDDSHLKSDNNVRNGTKKFKIERKCPKSDGCAQKRTEGSEIG